MRRVLSVAFLSALLAATPAMIAQRGGGGHAGGFGGGHAGGFSGGHVGGFAGHSFGGGFGGQSFGSPGRIYSGPGRIYTAPSRGFSTAPSRAFGMAPRMGWNVPARGLSPGYRSPYRSGYSGSRPDYRGATNDWRGGHGRDRGRYRGYGYGGYPYAPFLNSWELLPWDLGYPDFSGYDNGYDDSNGYDSAGIPSDIAAQPYADSSAPDDPDYRPDYAPYASNPWGAPQQAGDPVAPEPGLTLIFKDGHQQAIHNYALTPDTVIVMDQASSGRQQQIPLAELNLPATEQAAQQAGLQFNPPA